MRDLFGALIVGVGRGVEGAIAGPSGGSPARPSCERELNALCERINASLNVYSQVLGSRTARPITDEHVE